VVNEPGKSTLADKIDRLFHVVRRPDREPYSNEEVAKACREATGESFSTTYLWQLRTGRRDLVVSCSWGQSNSRSFCPRTHRRFPVETEGNFHDQQ